jgi:hypothetical protein
MLFRSRTREPHVVPRPFIYQPDDAQKRLFEQTPMYSTPCFVLEAAGQGQSTNLQDCKAVIDLLAETRQLLPKTMTVPLLSLNLASTTRHLGHVDDIKITRLPHSLAMLPTITDLNISLPGLEYNSLEFAVTSLPLLQKLSISGCGIQRLPPAIYPLEPEFVPRAAWLDKGDCSASVGGGWPCASCKTRNDLAQSSCMNCNTPCAKKRKVEEAQTRMREEARRPWGCPECTYLNVPQNTNCEMCNTVQAEVNIDIRINARREAAFQAGNNSEAVGSGSSSGTDGSGSGSGSNSGSNSGSKLLGVTVSTHPKEMTHLKEVRASGNLNDGPGWLAEQHRITQFLMERGCHIVF